MRYHYVHLDCVLRGTATPTLVRRAVSQKKAFAVLADEQPRGERREVLLMVGKTGREKIPLVLSDDSTVANIVGSCLCRTQGDTLVGVLGFASDADAQAVRARYEAGEFALHLTTRPITGVELMRGETFQGVDGPSLVLTSWEPMQIILDAD